MFQASTLRADKTVCNLYVSTKRMDKFLLATAFTVELLLAVSAQVLILGDWIHFIQLE